MCCVKNRLSCLLWNRCPQNLYLLLHCKGYYHLQKQSFSTFTNQLKQCATWLKENDCKDVYMESTGKYWISVYNILELSCNIVLPHPKYVKAIKGKKTDKRDAKWIADLFKHDLINGSFIPPADIHQLRDLTRYRNKLTNFIVGEKNRAQNCLTVSNIKLDDVFILWLDFYLQDSLM